MERVGWTVAIGTAALVAVVALLGGGCERKPSESKGGTRDHMARLAGYFAAHAIWSVSEGDDLVPIRAFETADGKRQMQRLLTGQDHSDPAESVPRGQKMMRDNAESAARAVLLYDGYITIEGTGRTEAIMLEAEQYTPVRRSFRAAIPYRSANHRLGFAVFKPKLVARDYELDAAGNARWGQEFFDGVHEHKEAAEIWDAKIDQSR